MEDSLNGNIAALRAFWNRKSFHDMIVESIERRNGRVIILLEHYILLLTGTQRYKQNIEEFPTPWISCVIIEESPFSKLNACLELGGFECEFANLRLMRRSDYSIFIPPIDSRR